MNTNQLKRKVVTALATVVMSALGLCASAEEALPTGYVQIDYIQSTGSQYINTGYKANKNTRIEAGFNTGARTGNWSAFFGATKDNQGILLRYYSNRSTLHCFFFGGDKETDALSGRDVTVTLKDGLLKINDKSYTFTTGNVSCNYEMYLFAQNNGGNVDAKQAYKLYWFKIYEGDALVRDYVPCRTPWNEIGLYDRVGKKFYGNFNSGAFVAPSNVPPPSRKAGEVTLPQGYSQLEWIESTGTQHIDTGYLPNRTTQVAASFRALTRKENWASFFGVMNNDSSNNAINLRYWEGTYNLNGLFCNDYRNSKTSGTYENAEVMAAVRDGAMVIDGNVYKFATSADPYQGSLILFGERNGNEIRRRQAMRLYWLTIYEGMTVVHDYVPCLREQDGVCGLYDLAADVFKPNNGTGVFKGSDIAAYAKLNGDDYAYYMANGEFAAVPETGITGLPLAFANDAEYQALVANPERVAQASGVFLEKDVTLTADADWSTYDFDFSFNYVGHTVNLNGHKLTVSKLNGNGTVTDASGTDYQLLTYLQSDGTAYINTGYKANKNTRIEASFNTGARSGNWSAFFGATKDNQGILLRYYSNRNTLHCFFFGGDKETDAMSGKDVTVTLKDGLLKINDTSYTFTTGNVSCDYAMYIFAQNSGGNVDAKQAYKLYSFKIYEGETLVHDFAPARRLSDGVLGLLDLAQTGEAFYVNANQNGGFSMAAERAGLGIRHYGAAGGELHVNVAKNQTVDNTSVALTGTLKLVKDGTGTFVAHREGQTYSGGTQVTGGQFAIFNSAQDSTAWMPSTHGTLGEVGSTIDVDTGARFNFVGNYDLCWFDIRLNGGRLESNNLPGDDRTFFLQKQLGWECMGNVTLTTDSKYLVRFDFLQKTGVVDLGGHTLDVEFTDGKTLFWGSGIQNGTLVVRNSDTSATGASWFKTQAAVDARTITFDMYEQFNLANDFNVSNYVSHSRNDLATGHSGTAALNVYGTFTPVTDFFYGCTMQNGSTIDLSTRKGVWSTTSRSTTGKTVVEFAKGATISIDLGARHGAGDKGKIVAWTEKPENVTFALAKNVPGWLEVSDDGIYLRRGLTLFVR